MKKIILIFILNICVASADRSIYPIVISFDDKGYLPLATYLMEGGEFAELTLIDYKDDVLFYHNKIFLFCDEVKTYEDFLNRSDYHLVIVDFSNVPLALAKEDVNEVELPREIRMIGKTVGEDLSLMILAVSNAADEVNLNLPTSNPNEMLSLNIQKSIQQPGFRQCLDANRVINPFLVRG